MASADPLDRFYQYVTAGPGGCHIWTGGLSDGYGGFWADGATHRAHLWLWRHLRGTVPARRILDHYKCTNRRCVNLDHLRPVTHRENLLRSEVSGAAINRAKQFCPEQHPYDEDNTYVDPRTGSRSCRKCRNRASRAYLARKAAR